MSAPTEVLAAPGPPSAPRRHRWRRWGVVAVLLALVVGYVWWRGGDAAGWPAGYGRWAEDVTRGDLAGDRAAVDEVLDAWTHSRGLTDDGVVTTRLLEHPLDDAQVVWVARVDGQITAVVRQQLELTYDRFQDDDIYGSTTGYAFGFLRGPAGAVRIQRVSVDWGRPSPASPTLGAWVSLAPPLAVLLDLGTALQVATGPLAPASDGTSYSRPFAPVTFDRDGVAVLRLRPGAHAADAVVGPVGTSQEAYALLGAPFPDDDTPLAAAWLPGPDPDAIQVVPVDGLAAAPEGAGGSFGPLVADFLDTTGGHSYSTGSWVLAGSVQDDWPATVGVFRLETTWRLGLVYGSWGRTKVYDAGPIHVADPLPVAVRLPGGGGWIVGAPGATLSYRTPGEGPWRSAGRQAALLPDADRWEVRVTTSSGAQTVVRSLAPVG